jgi:hypothetical protein
VLVNAALYAIALGSVIIGKALVATRLRLRPTGWRYVVGVVLRNEHAKFGVSCFGLKVPGVVGETNDFHSHVAQQLAHFLQSEPEARYRLRHETWITKRLANEHVDLVTMHFNPDGTLARIEPILTPTRPENADPATRETAHAAIVTAYNRSRHLSEDRRAAELLADLCRTTTGNAACYAERLLNAACVSFEPVPFGTERFAPPEFRERRFLGFGFLKFIVRLEPLNGTADVWVLAHHTGTDGVPLQELVSRLERAWGSVPVMFPEPETPAIGPHPCFVPGEREVYETISFHDFSPLLALRKKLNVRLAAEIGGDITFGALFLWRLAQEPEFAGLKASCTADIAATATCERDVDLVVLRPAEFGTDDDALVKYSRAFNQLVSDCRARKSPVRRIAQGCGLIPTGVYRKLVERSPDVVRGIFGDVGLSILRDAKMFIAPLSDVGFPQGFIAIGGVGLPTTSGRTVGAVSVKGDRPQAEQYPAILRRMLERCKDA